MIFTDIQHEGIPSKNIEWDEAALDEAWNEAINEYKMQKNIEKEKNIEFASKTEIPPENMLKNCPGEQKLFEEDLILKNLLISWYNAGYYAGLLEGQRR